MEKFCGKWVRDSVVNADELMIAKGNQGVFLVKMKNAFVPVKHVNSVNKNFNCPTRE